jgi:HK97 family phage major capsid protein
MPAPESVAVEYLQHTGNTNPAAPVAELGVKPDLGMQLTTVTTPYVKIAALASVSMEALQEFEAFLQWVPRELQRAVIDCETNEVVNGSGTAPHMRGLLNTSGTLTRAIGSDTPVDCVRKAINDLRVGASFVTANLILMNPTTWQDLTLQKSTQGQYLLNPSDPNALGTLTTIFGCNVITNTYIAPGTAIVCDSNFIYAWTRRGLTVDMNAHGMRGQRGNRRNAQRVGLDRNPARINVCHIKNSAIR